MKDYLAAIIQRIREGAYYHGLSQKCPVDSAVEVEAIKDVDDLELARDEFFAAYGLTSQVWARIPKRFPNFRNTNASGTRALAYMCQLPLADCQDLYIEMVDHLDEPNVHDTARRRVNEIKDAKKQQRKPRAAKATLAERIGHHIFNNSQPTAFELICAEPEIENDLARRRAEQDEVFPEVAAALAARDG